MHRTSTISTFNRFVNILAHGTRPLVSRGLSIMLEGETPHSRFTIYMRNMGLPLGSRRTSCLTHNPKHGKIGMDPMEATFAEDPAHPNIMVAPREQHMKLK
ncbi:isotrichodermin C-15 hydroxylase (cytochrome P-450 monooxygenase CYP65A1) [Colletotrichum asianum]